MIQSRRLTVLWCHGERMIRNDDWRTMTEPLLGGDELWVGYTFQEIRRARFLGRCCRVRAHWHQKSEGVRLHRVEPQPHWREGETR